MGQPSRAALVTGATGLLGRQVVQAFEYPGKDWSAKGTGLSRADGVDVLKVDLGVREEVEAALDKVKYVPLPSSCSRIGSILTGLGDRPKVVVHCMPTPPTPREQASMDHDR